MTRYRFTSALVGLSIVALCWLWPGQAAAQVHVDVGPVHVHVNDRPAPPEAVEVLTRGPIHEAFAEPIALDEDAALTISQAPPASIDEAVPDEKPAGNNIVWIPGYWSWDTDRNDFIWVSGCWRAVPPNCSWVPGYWASVRSGYQWVPGFWTTADTDELNYLPAPPATLEEGPIGTPASADNVWIPGCWVRHEGRYVWRPGFWAEARTNWVWEPAHYVYTPHGCVFVEGYWDRPLDRRGVAFLPVYASPRLYGRSDFRYSPQYVLDLGLLTSNLFISPGRHHYYFGDYYGSEYARAGFHPWYEAREHHGWYDPIYVHEQWRHRDDHKWAENQRVEYEHRRDDKAARPARTYEAMKAQAAHLPEKDRRDAYVARPMRDVVSDKATPYKFDKLDTKTREATANNARDVHAYRDQRAKWESQPVTPRETLKTPGKETPKAPAGQDTQAQRVKISRSPVTVREPLHDKDLTPPDKPKQPNLDPNAKPRSVKDTQDRSKDTQDRSKDSDHSDKDKSGSRGNNGR